MVEMLKPHEIDWLEYAMKVYGGSDKVIDANDLGNVCRAMNCNPSLETLEKLGASKKPGEKKMKIDEIAPIIIQLRKQKRYEGCYEEFVECLKLYDKNKDGHMMATALSETLLTLGEKLDAAQLEELFDDCLDDEDEDGQIEYVPFLRRVCDLDPPLNRKKE